MGAGSVADFGHAPAIASNPNLVLHAVYDPVFERAVSLQKKYGAEHAYHDLDLFFNSGLDAVTITSPAPYHRTNLEQAAKRDLPVLCEKPLAMDRFESEVMINAMASRGLPLGVGFCYRFSPISQQIRELVESKRIGEVRSLRLIYLWNLHGIYEQSSEGHRIYSPQRAARMEEGGPMVDCGVHMIDLARWWLKSEISEVTEAGAWVEEYEAPDHAYLHLRHECGALTTVEMGFTYTHTSLNPISHFTYQLIGTEGLIRFDRDIGLFEVRDQYGTETFPWASEKNFSGMYSCWSEVLETGNIGEMPTGSDGLIATEIARDSTNRLILKRPAHLPKQPQKE